MKLKFQAAYFLLLFPGASIILWRRLISNKMNGLESILFYISSAIAIAASLVVVTSKRPVYGVLALVAGILALSALFALLKAYFVAIIQILIYAGAIIVLFLFVIMLLGIEGMETTKDKQKSQWIVSLLLVSAFLAELAVVFAAFADSSIPQKNLIGTVEAIGQVLFSKFLLPFELISGILLIGILGVVELAKKQPRDIP